MGKSIKEFGKELAKELSNFDGDFVGFEGDFIDYAGATRIDQANEEKGFSVQIVNSSLRTEKIALFGGILPSTKANLVVAGNNTVNGGAANNIVVNALSGNYNKLIAYLRDNPSLLVAAQISATNTAQIDTTISYSFENPFVETDKSKVIRLSRFRDQDTFNPNMVLVALDIVTSKELILEMSVLPSTTVTIEFHIGAGVSLSKGLKSKADRDKYTRSQRKSLGRLGGI